MVVSVDQREAEAKEDGSWKEPIKMQINSLNAIENLTHPLNAI